jgi:hypothetical protein
MLRNYYLIKFRVLYLSCLTKVVDCLQFVIIMNFVFTLLWHVLFNPKAFLTSANSFCRHKPRSFISIQCQLLKVYFIFQNNISSFDTFL